MTFWEFINHNCGKLLGFFLVIGFTGGFGVWKGYFSTAENYALFQRSLIEIGKLIGLY